MKVGKSEIFAICGIVVMLAIGVFAVFMAIQSDRARSKRVVCCCRQHTQHQVMRTPSVKTATVLRKTLEGRQNVATKLRLDDGTEEYVNLSDTEVKYVQLLDRGDKITYSLTKGSKTIIIHSIKWNGDTGKVKVLPNGLRTSTVTHSARTGRHGKMIILRLEDGTCEYVDRTDSEEMGNNVLSLQKGDKVTYSLSKYGNIIVHSIQWSN